MEIIVHGPRLYVVLDRVEERQVGRIVLSDQHSERTRIGVVRGVGEDVERYRVGDKVLVSYHSGVVIDSFELRAVTDGQDVHRIFVESEILGHVRE